MSQTKIKQATVLLALIVLAACSSAKASAPTMEVPEWFLNKNAAYPEQDYLAAVGEGDTLKHAQQAAQAELAAIFKTRIRENTTSNLHYENALGAAVKSIRIDRNIRRESDQTLQAMELSRHYTDNNGKTYIVAYINRARAARIYSEQIRNNTAGVNSLLLRATKNTSNLVAYALLDASLELADQNLKLLDTLAIIKETSRRFAEPSYDLRELRTQRSQVAQKLSFTINIEGDDTGAIADSLAGQLQKLGFPKLEQDASMKLTGSFSYESIELKNKYENIAWDLAVEMLSDRSESIISLHTTNRSSGNTRDRAIKTMNIQVLKLLNKQFEKQLYDYFASLL